MKENKIPEQICPYCGYKMDRSTPVVNEDDSPRPGDWSVCLNCSKVAVFDSKLIQRLPTEEEKLLIAVNPEVLNARIAIIAVNKPDLRK